MRKTLFHSILTSLLLILTLTPAAAQESAPLQALAGAGASTEGEGGGMFSFTLGQAAFLHFGVEGTVEEGVQQVFGLPTYDTIELSVCQGDSAAVMAVMPQGYQLPSDVNPAQPGGYSLTSLQIKAGGIDSSLVLRLTVLPHNDTTIAYQQSGDYLWRGETFTQSGTYTRTLESLNGCDSTITLQLALIHGAPIPVIYSYEDRIAVTDHNADGYKGVRYAYYRWYRDGVLVAEGEDMDSYQEGGALLSGCIVLEVPTTEERDVWVRSNVLCMGENEDGGYDPLKHSGWADLTITPNPTRSGDPFAVRIMSDDAVDGATLKIYDVQGRTIHEQSAYATTNVQARLARGIYTVQVFLPSGMIAMKKIIVN